MRLFLAPHPLWKLSQACFGNTARIFMSGICKGIFIVDVETAGPAARPRKLSGRGTREKQASYWGLYLALGERSHFEMSSLCFLCRPAPSPAAHTGSLDLSRASQVERVPVRCHLLSQPPRAQHARMPPASEAFPRAGAALQIVSTG